MKYKSYLSNILFISCFTKRERLISLGYYASSLMHAKLSHSLRVIMLLTTLNLNENLFMFVKIMTPH